MKHTLKILIPILLILALLIGACCFFLIARRDLTESVFTYWGNHFYNNGRYGRAITCYKLAMHFAPKDAELAIWLSNAYKRSGNYTKAEYTLVNAITQSPDAADLYIAPETYRRRQELAEERFSHMIAYAANETECRSTVLERYFGAADPAPCGVCDICLAARKRAKSAEAPLDEEILRQLDAEPLAVKELAARFRCDAERVLEAVERLQHAGKISTAESGKLAINR